MTNTHTHIFFKGFRKLIKLLEELEVLIQYQISRDNNPHSELVWPGNNVAATKMCIQWAISTTQGIQSITFTVISEREIKEFSEPF